MCRVVFDQTELCHQVKVLEMMSKQLPGELFSSDQVIIIDPLGSHPQCVVAKSVYQTMQTMTSSSKVKFHIAITDS
jgi:hypothetical protein